MNKRNVLFFVFDGFADWEAAYALAGINRSHMYSIKTLALKKEQVTSMGGITVCPDLDFFPLTDLKDIDSTNTAMLILPGGVAWEDGKNQKLSSLVMHCMENRIPVAGICEATIFLAQLGVIDRCEPDRIIAADATAAVEFAANIFDLLEITGHQNVKKWFQYFQNKEVALS